MLEELPDPPNFDPAQHRGSILASHPAAPGSIPSIPTNFSMERVSILVGEVNQQRWLEESGQWLENVDRTHPVLASGKPVIQKNYVFLLFTFLMSVSSCHPEAIKVRRLNLTVSK